MAESIDMVDMESSPPSHVVATYSPAAFKSLQYNYLLVYLIVMMSDWLQGPYLYKLYQFYGYQMFDIAFLFMAGFVSGAVFTTIMGGVADSWGRKRMCLIFCLTSSLACFARLNSDFSILFISHLLSGLSGGLLNTIFEAWYVAEHQKRGFPATLLSITFSTAVFFNGLVAIFSGIIANKAVELGGYKAPFVTSIGFLALAAGVMSSAWSENYGDGDSEKHHSVAEKLRTGWQTLKNDTNILALGTAQTLFESSMYVFVLLYTPALENSLPEFDEDDESTISLGYLFSTLMLAVMLGSASFRFLVETVRRKWKEDKILVTALGIAGVAFWGVALKKNSTRALLICYHLFEFTTGLYFPSIASLRAEAIPEASRAAVMALLRVPMNVVVCAILWQVDTLSISMLFAICAVMTFAGAAVVSLRFAKRV